MSSHRNKNDDKKETLRLILDSKCQPYVSGENWLGHGARGGRDAMIDYLLLDGATMDRLLQERGSKSSIRSHFQSLKVDHDLPVLCGNDKKYGFDREHLEKTHLPVNSSSIESKLYPEGESNNEDNFTDPIAIDIGSPPADRVATTIQRIVRDTALATEIKRLHQQCCQICGDTITLADGSGYSEGHHIKPLGSPCDGPDVVGNIICLCPNHHAMCDFGAILLDMNQLHHVADHKIEQQYIDYHSKNIYRGSLCIKISRNINSVVSYAT